MTGATQDSRCQTCTNRRLRRLGAHEAVTLAHASEHRICAFHYERNICD